MRLWLVMVLLLAACTPMAEAYPVPPTATPAPYHYHVYLPQMVWGD